MSHFGVSIPLVPHNREPCLGLARPCELEKGRVILTVRQTQRGEMGLSDSVRFARPRTPRESRVAHFHGQDVRL